MEDSQHSNGKKGLDLWSKVDFGLTQEAQNESGDSEASDEATPVERLKQFAKNWKILRLVLDVLGTLLWAYIFLQTFVFDVDDDLIAQYAPAGDLLTEYKFLVFVTAVAVLVVVLRKRALLAIAYIALFPAVVVLWKLPKLLYKINSWVVFFSFANVFSAAVTHLRWSVVALAVGLVSVVLVLAAGSSILIGAGMAAIAGLMLAALYRSVRYAMSPSSFLQTQERAIDRVVDSSVLGALVEVNETLTDRDIETFNSVQQNQFVANLSFGLLAHRLLYLWAYQLDRYRQSSAPFCSTWLLFWDF